MSRQTEILPEIVRRCRSVDASCGVQLQGSVARVTEREVCDVDVNWIRRSELLAKADGEGYAGWWHFANGRPIHDPDGLAAECRATMRAWFARQPAVRAAWERKQAELEAHERDRSRSLAYPTFGDFHRYVKTLVIAEGEG